MKDQDPWAATGVVAQRCLAEPACEDAFAAKLAEVNDVFEGFMLEERAQAIRTQIEPFVMEDPRKEYDMNEFAAKYEEMSAFFAGRPARIRELLMDHGY